MCRPSVSHRALLVPTPAAEKTLLKDPERLAIRLKEIPQEPGVYFMKDETDHILYIGKSKSLRNRVRSYFRDGAHHHTPRIGTMVQKVAEIEFIVTDTEAEALALEANLIKQHQPHFNVLLKDDKKYPYLCITWGEDYPRIFITRKRRKDAKSRYYGPYVDTGLLRRTLQIAKRIFPLRQRRQPLFKDRPCLNYSIGQCPGVCQALITPEDYHKIVQRVAMVFQGRSQELIEILTAQMHKAAEEMNFEKAAMIRDQLKGLDTLSANQKVALPDGSISRDAIALSADDEHSCVQLFQIRAGRLVGRLGFVADTQSGTPGEILQRVLEEHYRLVDPVEIPSEVLVQHALPEADMLAEFLTVQKTRKVVIEVPQRQMKAELVEMVERNAQHELARTQRFADRNNQAMQDLSELADLPGPPKRIEGYDISHVQGSDAVASQVVFVDGLPAKQHYRTYKIKNPTVTSGHSDDFASMAEVIRRRFRRYAEDPNLKRLGNPDWPDLVMIDGGKGQLSAVVAELEDMNLLSELNVVSLAKRLEEVFTPGAKESLDTQPDQPGILLLRRLRDEAHRFAVGFHRKKRTDRMRRSRLEDIPGLGHQRRKQLLGEFRSIDYIREASPKQLATVDGIGPMLAQQIYDYFHPSAAAESAEPAKVTASVKETAPTENSVQVTVP